MHLKLVLRLGFAIWAGLVCASGVHAIPTLIGQAVDVQISFLLPSAPGSPPISAGLDAAGNPITVLPIFDGPLPSVPFGIFSYELSRNGNINDFSRLSFTPIVVIGADSITVGLSGPGLFAPNNRAHLPPGSVQFNFEFPNLPFAITDVQEPLACLSPQIAPCTLLDVIATDNALTDLGFSLNINDFVTLADSSIMETAHLSFQEKGPSVPEPGTLALLAGVAIAAIAVRKSLRSG